MSKLKRGISVCLVILIAYYFQTIFFPRLLPLSPNLFLILVVFFGIMGTPYTGMCVGFAVGILLDCIAGAPCGAATLLYTVIGYISSLYHRNFYGTSFLRPIGLLAAMDLAYGMAVYFLCYFFRHGIHIAFYLFHIMIPEMIYTTFVGILLYKLISAVNNRTIQEIS